MTIIERCYGIRCTAKNQNLICFGITHIASKNVHVLTAKLVSAEGEGEVGEGEQLGDNTVGRV